MPTLRTIGRGVSGSDNSLCARAFKSECGRKAPRLQTSYSAGMAQTAASLHFRTRMNCVSQRNLTEPHDGPDRKDRRSADARAVDAGAVRRIQVRDEQLVVGKADDAMFAR